MLELERADLTCNVRSRASKREGRSPVRIVTHLLAMGCDGSPNTRRAGCEPVPGNPKRVMHYNKAGYELQPLRLFALR